MSFLSETHTDVALPAQLAVFSIPPNQASVQNVSYVEFRPISTISGDDSPIEFFISGQGQQYTDLRKSRLYIKAMIKKADGSNLGATEHTGIINLPLQSMWSQMEVTMNGKLVSLNTSNYQWKAYMKMMQNSVLDVDDSQLEGQLFYKDDPDMDETDPGSGTNAGLIKRSQWTKLSKHFELEGPLFEDIFNMDKYLINGVDIGLKLYRTSPQFMIMSGEASPAYKLIILDAVFKACRITLDSGLLLAHTKQLAKTPAKYFFNQN